METANAAPPAPASSIPEAPEPTQSVQPSTATDNTTVTTKTEPTAPAQEPEEPCYVVDSGVSDEELARSVKSINDFSVELERMRTRMQQRQPRQ